MVKWNIPLLLCALLLLAVGGFFLNGYLTGAFVLMSKAGAAMIQMLGLGVVCLIASWYHRKRDDDERVNITDPYADKYLTRNPGTSICGEMRVKLPTPVDGVTGGGILQENSLSSDGVPDIDPDGSGRIAGIKSERLRAVLEAGISIRPNGPDRPGGVTETYGRLRPIHNLPPEAAPLGVKHVFGGKEPSLPIVEDSH